MTLTRNQIRTLQSEVGEWSRENFGGVDVQPPKYPLSGMFEEFGELVHSELKMEQGIRLDEDEVGEDASKDAIGDIVIYSCDFAERSGIEIANNVSDEEEFTDGYESFDSLLWIGSSLGLLVNATYNHGRDDVGLTFSLLYNHLGGVCEWRGYDFEECVLTAADEVLDREWDSHLTDQ